MKRQTWVILGVVAVAAIAAAYWYTQRQKQQPSSRAITLSV